MCFFVMFLRQPVVVTVTGYSYILCFLLWYLWWHTEQDSEEVEVERLSHLFMQATC